MPRIRPYDLDPPPPLPNPNEDAMANPGRNWNPPGGYRGVGAVPTSGSVRPTLLLGGKLNRPMPWPPVPKSEIERITGRTHLSLYNEREAEREYDAWMRGENYQYQTPPIDIDGYLLNQILGVVSADQT